MVPCGCSLAKEEPIPNPTLSSLNALWCFTALLRNYLIFSAFVFLGYLLLCYVRSGYICSFVRVPLTEMMVTFSSLAFMPCLYQSPHQLPEYGLELPVEPSSTSQLLESQAWTAAGTDLPPEPNGQCQQCVGLCHQVFSAHIYFKTG